MLLACTAGHDTLCYPKMHAPCSLATSRPGPSVAPYCNLNTRRCTQAQALRTRAILHCRRAFRQADLLVTPAAAVTAPIIQCARGGPPPLRARPVPCWPPLRVWDWTTAGDCLTPCQGGSEQTGLRVCSVRGRAE
jgi:hypothetical protein